MGVPLLLGAGHVFFTDGLFDNNPALNSYLLIISVAGTLAYFYKTLFYSWLRKTYSYRVETVRPLNDSVVEIGLIPEVGHALKLVPGQFAFFSFKSSEISEESHPYTIIKEENGLIYIMVKQLGDYTKRLYKFVKPGIKANIDGPYGCFDFWHGMNRQVWIGGGVGIAPFISWINSLLKQPKPGLSFDLYYCSRSKNEACYVRDLQERIATMANANFHMVCDDTDGLLDPKGVKDLMNSDIFICGPKEMRKSLSKQMQKLGVAKARIHSEDFDFV